MGGLGLGDAGDPGVVDVTAVTPFVLAAAATSSVAVTSPSRGTPDRHGLDSVTTL
jgi:hypothetical protein